MVIKMFFDIQLKAHDVPECDIAISCTIDNSACHYACLPHFLTEAEDERSAYYKLCTVDLLKNKIIKLEKNIFGEKYFSIIKK